uniref:Glycosyltransferase 25 family member n=1 Tax=Globodera rostochiensis TaxID=31243 RepID=A0A914HCF8_GLORO
MFIPRLIWFLLQCFFFCILFSEFICATNFPRGEGDYRHLYRPLCVGIKVNDNEHVLSYFMGMVEELRYPKDRMHILFFASKPNSISEWMKQFPRGFYRLTLLSDKFENWREEALLFGRSKSCGFVLIMDSDCFLLRDSLRQLISLDKLAVSPLLVSPCGGQSNVHGLLGDEFVSGRAKNAVQVYYSNGPLLIDLSRMDSSYLTFDQNNILNYRGSGDPIDVFAFSAFAMNIPIFFSNLHNYGFYIGSNALSKTEHMAVFGTFLADWVSNVGPMPFPVSSALQPWYPVPIKFGFDRIYLINLQRRPERLAKMREVLRLVGLDFNRFEAVDGQNLTGHELSTIRFLPGFEDPYFKRPMKKGEIGCFLSHFKVWEDIVQNGHQRAIVLEDDVRFSPNGTLILKRIIEDLTRTRLEWDLIYLGRKRIVSDEAFVPGHRFLSSVAYSHWTLGYAISGTGARKLIAARPLERLLTLDEFLPIMYNRHPNAKWSAHFSPRDLRAFAAFPSVVEPERYTNQPGYVSDTEGSEVMGEFEGDSGDVVDVGHGSFAFETKEEL